VTLRALAPAQWTVLGICPHGPAQILRANKAARANELRWGWGVWEGAMLHANLAHHSSAQPIGSPMECPRDINNINSVAMVMPQPGEQSLQLPVEEEVCGGGLAVLCTWWLHFRFGSDKHPHKCDLRRKE